MSVTLELVLVGGERRRVDLPSHSGEVANALDRLDNWIATDGGWVQKQFIVEVRMVDTQPDVAGNDEEFAGLACAADELADQAARDAVPGA
jgi:hypothetical protein